MGKRIAVIVLIFLATSVAWMILGSTIFARTYSFGSKLEGAVVSTWGTRQEQAPPSASYREPSTKRVTTMENGREITREEPTTVSVPVPLESTRADVAFDLDYRQKGLLWYSTYKVNFAGAYSFRNPGAETRDLAFTFKLPAARAIYDDLQVTVDGRPVEFTNHDSAVTAHATVAGGQPAVMRVAYRSQGLENWTYKFGGDVTQVRDFVLAMHTNFKAIDFPENTLSPTEKRETAQGWDLTWRYANLLSGFQIGMTMPQRLQPGPLAGQISFFAPVSLLFFFFLMFIITTLRGIDLHPMNYFFLACAFFAFHLLLAYTVDHISIHAAFALASGVSVLLVVSYLRLVVGMRFAAVEAGLSQLIYLVLFSYAFFFQGFTGLAVTVGAIVTLFVVMQMTGRIRWTEKFAAKPANRNPLNGESWVRG